MPVVDPVAAAAVLDAIQENAAAAAGRPGATGAVGRAHEAYAALMRWLVAEVDAGTHFPDIADATAQIAGAFMASTALTIGRAEAVPLVAAKITATASDTCQGMAARPEVHLRAPIHQGSRQ